MTNWYYIISDKLTSYFVKLIGVFIIIGFYPNKFLFTVLPFLSINTSLLHTWPGVVWLSLEIGKLIYAYVFMFGVCTYLNTEYVCVCGMCVCDVWGVCTDMWGVCSDTNDDNENKK